MLNLDPAKLIVIAVVAIILLGPDRLPQVAKQVGAAWRSFNEFRHRMESEVRSTMPDLPPTSEIARLARSPSALLHHLSTMSDEDDRAGGGRGCGRRDRRGGRDRCRRDRQRRPCAGRRERGCPRGGRAAPTPPTAGTRHSRHRRAPTAGGSDTGARADGPRRPQPELSGAPW